MEKYRNIFVLFCDGLERRRRLINRREEEREQSKVLAKDRASSGPEKMSKVKILGGDARSETDDRKLRRMLQMASIPK